MDIQAQIESSLREALPDALPANISRLARFLTSFAGGELLAVVPDDPHLIAVLHKLLGTLPQPGGLTVAISSGGRDSHLSITGDVAGFKLHVESATYEFTLPPASALGIPRHAPLPPAHMVPRPEAIAPLKEHLLGGDPPCGRPVISAVHGLGGIGKTTIAAALAHDPEVKAHFSDGILWVTLGQHPDLLPALNDLGKALGGKADLVFTTLEGAKGNLGSLLHNKTALLIVDDVWSSEHVEWFLIGGEGCRVLITTRRPSVADNLGAQLLELDVMSPEQAVCLLSQRIDNPLEGEQKHRASLVAEDVGYLPLALELAASRVRLQGPGTWDRLHAALQEEIARLELLEEPSLRRKGQAKVQASLSISLNALREDDEATWEVFAQLGLVAEDALVTACMAATLFEASEEEADEALKVLWDHGLLSRASKITVANRAWQGYSIHDLVRDAAHSMLVKGGLKTDVESLDGENLLASAHRALLERYRQKCPSGLWHLLPDDGYIHAHLSWHMERARVPEALHQLLREETAEGRNGWHQARERLGQTSGYAEDVERAWRLVDALPGEVDLLPETGLRCRYALILSSLRSLSSNITPALLEALVQAGLWSAEQGLAHIQRMDEEVRQAASLRRIGRYLPPNLMESFLLTAHSIPEDYSRAEALSAIAEFLPAGQREQALRQAISTAQTISDVSLRAEALAAVAENLPPGHREQALPQVLNAAHSISDDYYRAEALSAIAEFLPAGQREQALLQALNAAHSISLDITRAWPLAVVARALAKAGQSEQALSAAGCICFDPNRVEALAAIAENLPPGQREQALPQVLNAAHSISDDYYRAKALAAVAEFLPAGQREQTLLQALNAAHSISDDDWRAEALAAVARGFAKAGLSEQALNAVQSISSDDSRAEALAGVAASLPPGQREQALPQALNDVQSMSSDLSRAEALAAVAEFLPANLLEQALSAAQSISDDYYRAEALASVARALAKAGQRLAKAGQSEQALSAARSIAHAPSRAEVLAAVAEFLPPSQREQALLQALSAAQTISDASSRAEVLSAVAEFLPPGQREQALLQAVKAAHSIWDASSRAEALVAVAEFLPPDQREEALLQALNASHSISNASSRVEALAAVAKFLPPGQREQALLQALNAAHSISDDYYRAKALAAIAEFLPAGQREQALLQALKVVHSISDVDFSLDRALTALARGFAKAGQSEQAFSAAQTISSASSRAEALSAVAEFLPPGQREQALLQALSNAQSISESSSRAEALVAVAGSLPPGQREQALLQAISAAEFYNDIPFQAKVLAALGESLPPGQWEQAFQQVLNAAQSLTHNYYYRAEALAAVAALLPPGQREQALLQALTAARSVPHAPSQVEALATVARGFAKAGLSEQALSAAQSISDDYYRAEALKTVLSLVSQSSLPLSLLSTPLLDVLHRSATCTRKVLLSDVQTLLPLIARVGGDRAVAELVQAIEDVARWWH